MDRWVTTLNAAELLGVALVVGVVGSTLISAVPIMCWLIYEWVDERLRSPPHSEVAPTPPRRLNG